MPPVDPAELLLPATSALLGFGSHLRVCVRVRACVRGPTVPACHKQPVRVLARPSECVRAGERTRQLSHRQHGASRSRPV